MGSIIRGDVVESTEVLVPVGTAPPPPKKEELKQPEEKGDPEPPPKKVA